MKSGEVSGEKSGEVSREESAVGATRPGDLQAQPDSHTAPRGQASASGARVEWLLVALVVFTLGYFNHPTNWNHIARFDPILSFVEPGTPDQLSLRIDHQLVDPIFGRNTGDWARNPDHDDHYYSNKPPGPMLLGIPIYALLYGLEASWGAAPESQAWTHFNRYWLNLWISILPLALAARFFFRWLSSAFALGEREALATTLLLCFGTLLFPYATQLWGHVTAAAFIMLALCGLTREGRAGPALAGLSIGMAVLCEYSAAITLLGMVALLVFERRWRALVAFALGGLPPFLVYGVYHGHAFGRWLTVASAFNNPKFLEAEKVAGIFGPIESEAFFGLTFSAHHGLFTFMPVLLLLVPACWMIRRGPGQALRWMALGNVLGYALMNLFFNGWHGGFCLGPRYLIPSLPFYVVLLIPLLKAWRSWGRPASVVVAGLAALSVANMAILAIFAPSTSIFEERAANPLARHYGALLAGGVGELRHSPIRLDGDWRVAGQTLSSRNGFLEPGEEMEATREPFVATSVVRAREREPVRIELGWQGRLELTLGGETIVKAQHPDYERTSVTATLQPGENALRVSLESDGAPRLYLIALGPMGQPRLPRPDASHSELPLPGANLGETLGLDGAWSLLPWLAGIVGLATRLTRATRVAYSSST